MNWFQVKGFWVCKLKASAGQYKTLSSRIKASEVGIKWSEEKRSITSEAEKAILKRVASEGLEIQGRTVKTFDEACTLYKESFNYDRYIMNAIEKEFKDRIISEITPLDIRRYHNKILESCSTSTWNRHRNVLNAIFNRAREWGFDVVNPVTSVKRYPETRTKVFLSKVHEQALLKEAEKEDFYLFAFVKFALKTGRRICEIVSLEWDDIDFGKEIIRFQIGKKKGGKEIHYRKPPKSLFQTLFALRHTNRQKPFPYFPRKAWQRVRDRVDKAMGLPDGRFHALRHRCATALIEKGATLYDVQHYLCHSNPATTTIYAHVSDQRDERIASFLE